MSCAVVVTGMGAVTPLGVDLATSWVALIAGRDAEAPVELFDTSGCRCHRAATAQLPDLPGLPAKMLHRLPRASRLAIPAVRAALARAGLLDAEGRSVLRELPFSVSTTAGAMALGENFLRGLRAGQRQRLLAGAARYLPHQQVLDIQQALGFSGPSILVANACASGANAIGHAADMISSGAADCVLAGGFEALTELVFVGFDCLQATTTEKCRPFDLNRSGLLLGEAAAFIVLESEERARARSARPICRLGGYGHTTDFFHLTQPEPNGTALTEVMRAAAEQAGVAPVEIGYINAHGTATAINDPAEAKAYTAFLDGALPAARISSTKAAIGHTLGAAGAIEAVFAIEALRTGELPPQLNLREPLPEIAPALARAGEKRAGMRHTMSVNLGFGGSNAALIFSS
jgi:3-oxoacyl-[acyl-carrier-protein] synthase II